MGCSAEGYPSGCAGPVAEPEPPVSPEVVGIDSDRQIPADRSIYVGEYANFNLVMYPVDYECVESDFSCDTAGVTLSLLEGYTNVLKIDVADTVTPGTEVNVFFKSQKIMHVSVVETPVRVISVVDGKSVPYEHEFSSYGDDIFVAPVFDKEYVVNLDDFRSTNDRLKITSDDGLAVQYWGEHENQSWDYEIYFKDQLIMFGTINPSPLICDTANLNPSNLSGKMYPYNWDMPVPDNAVIELKISYNEGESSVNVVATGTTEAQFEIPEAVGTGICKITSYQFEEAKGLKFDVEGTLTDYIAIELVSYVNDGQTIFPGYH